MSIDHSLILFVGVRCAMMRSDFVSARHGSMNKDNRRGSRRFTISSTVEIFHKGYAIEFPTRDISATGAGIVACGVDHLTAGDQVLVTLSPELELNAWIVKADNDMLHLAFDPAMQREVEDYLEEAHGLLDDTVP